MASNLLRSLDQAKWPFLLFERSKNWIIVQTTFLQLKWRKNELEKKLQRDIKNRVSYDLNHFGLQFHHSTWFNWGPNNCSSGQQAKFVDCFSIFSPDKTKEQRIKGNAAMGYQSLGKSRFEAKHLGQQFNHSPSFNWGEKNS